MSMENDVRLPASPPLADAPGSEIRPFEEQTALERTIRAKMWQPQDRLKRAGESLAGHVKKKEYQAAADCQSAMRKAASEIAIWEDILNLYEQERQSPNDKLSHGPANNQ